MSSPVDTIREALAAVELPIGHTVSYSPATTRIINAQLKEAQAALDVLVREVESAHAQIDADAEKLAALVREAAAQQEALEEIATWSVSSPVVTIREALEWHRDGWRPPAAAALEALDVLVREAAAHERELTAARIDLAAQQEALRKIAGLHKRPALDPHDCEERARRIAREALAAGRGTERRRYADPDDVFGAPGMMGG